MAIRGRGESFDTEIRTFDERDWPDVWAIFEPVVGRGDTFCYDTDCNEVQARALWLVDAPGRVAVATSQGEVVGTSNMYANRPGPGSHIASGSLMVAPAARRRGIGHALVADMLDWAQRHAFDGVQFNAVAASNVAAVRLYERLGFTVIGTVPGAFAHPSLGKVGLHIMFADLREHESPAPPRQ